MTHDVIVIGGDLAGLPKLDGDVIGSVFDDDSNSWTLTTADGKTCRARVVVARTSPLVPWTPDLFGRREFRGISFHAAAPPTDFDPAGQRIAVIGADAAAGQLIGRLTRSGATVKVFALAPRRFVRQTRRGRRYLRRQPELVTSPIDELTAAGIRTADGVHHDVDAIVYGTGFCVRAGLPPDTLVGAKGLTIQQAWTNGMEPCLGIAVHGFPNYFLFGGPDCQAAMRNVLECLELTKTHTRIELRRSSQQVFNERLHLHRSRQPDITSVFDLSSAVGVHDNTWAGPATLSCAGIYQQVRVLLSGHVDPVDGQYHWQGTVFDALPTDLVRARTVTIAVGDRSAPARITEETPQGNYSIAGVGAPPFALGEVELTG